MLDFAHLHVHSEYSLLDGFGTAENYAKKAKEIGYKYLALTNHGNVDGCIDFQKQCLKHGIKPILGCEFYIVPDATKRENKDRKHITILAKNQEGWQNILQMLTFANLEGFYYKPRIDYKCLLNHLNGLVIMSACTATFITDYDFLVTLTNAMPDINDFYLEVMPHNFKEQKELNKYIISIADELKWTIVATNDCHYIEKNDWKAQEVLLAIQTKAKWNDKERFKFQMKGLHLKTPAEMFQAFLKQNSLTKNEILRAMNNTIEIAEKCAGFRIKRQKIHLPEVPEYAGQDKAEILWSLCQKGIKNIDKNEWKKNKLQYLARLKEEFDLITSKKFEGYFLIVYELINWCKENDIMVGPGRGSVGGSLISYLLDITCVDPLEYDLLFSRFISEERIDYPDIDIDFEDRKRDLVKQHLEDLYGKGNIASVSTFLTMKGRGAIRDVARVFDIPYKQVDEFAKTIDDATGKDKTGEIQQAINQTNEGRQFYNKYPEVVNFAMKLEGQIKGVGQHAAASIISADLIADGTRAHLIKRKGNIAINWAMEDSEYVGLIKLDILGLSTLSILSETKKLIKQNHNADLTYRDIIPNDKTVLNEFALGHNEGVFQFSTYGLTDLCKKMKIKTFEDLVVSNSLYRPGTLRSGMVDEYLKRKNGRKFKGLHPKIDGITKDTFGIIIFQEQVMNLAYQLAGMPWKDADKIRKVIGKSKGTKELHKFKEQFVNGCVENKTLNKKVASKLWNDLESFGGYGFNRSHSVEYSLIGYWTQWFKTYYPTEFICASLTFGSEGNKESLIKEALRLGLKLVLPKVGISDSHKWVAKDNYLYIPFIEVKGFGDKTSKTASVFKRKAPAKRQGFFGIKDKAKEQSNNKKTKMEKILDDIGAFDNNTQIPDTAKDYFSFQISQNPKLIYPELFKIMNPRKYKVQINDIIKGQINKIPVIQKKRFRNTDIIHCDKCELRNECTKPVPSSMGIYNIMICAEAPGKDEDKQGMGFVGRAGNDILWPEIERYGLKRKHFHITNVVKCFTDPNTQIYTSKGLKIISEIEINDRVLTHKGRFRKVSWVQKDDYIPRGKKLIVIKYKHLGGGRKVKTTIVTPEHPFFIDDDWKEAYKIKKGDKLKILAKRCLQCNSKIPFDSIRDFCSKNCATIYSNKNREWNNESKNKVSKNMKGLYKTGILDASKITINANKKTRQLVKDGEQILLSKNRNFIHPFKGKTKYNCESIMRGSKKTYSANKENGHLSKLPLLGKQALENYYKKPGNKRKPISKNRNTKIELVMAWALKKRKIKFIHGQNLFHYYPDFIIDGYNLIVECDGLFWHSSDKAIKRDREKDDFLESKGYTVLRFTDNQINKDVFSCIDEIERIMSNHNGEYEFMETEIVSVRQITTYGKRKLYNFAVWGDNSYIANGLVSHNCWPSKTRTPNIKHIKACYPWLQEELERIDCRLILAFGNTAIKCFTEMTGGITKLSGKTEWNEKAKAWLCWCVHPAAVLHNKEQNERLFEEGIRNFIQTIKRFGIDEILY